MKIKGKKVLVTGGAGFIGSHLVDRLVKENKVVVIDNFSTGELVNLDDASKSGNLRIIKGDITDMSFVRKIMSNVDIVFHLAAKGVRESINSPMSVHETNSLGALNLYIAAHNEKIKRFIHISSSEVYGSARYVPMDENHPLNPETVYGASKLAGEFYGLAYSRTHNLPVIVVRPFNTYGPRSHFAGIYGEVIPRFVIRAMNNLAPVIFGNGKQTRDFTYVADTVSGIILAGESDDLVGGIVNIAYGKERTIKNVAEIILNILRKEKLGIRYDIKRPGDVKRHFADIRKARKMLKYEPKIALERGIKMYVNWFLKQKIDFKKALKKIDEHNW